jgi:very-short-patch-repair endonuclease
VPTARDADRDAWLGAAGFRVLRIWNTDVDRNLAGVLEAIRGALGG